MGFFSFYLPLNTAHRADFAHFCSVLLSLFWLATSLSLARFDRNFAFFFSNAQSLLTSLSFAQSFLAGSPNIIGYVQQKWRVFAHFARSCLLLLGSAQFFAGYIPCRSYRCVSCTFEKSACILCRSAFYAFEPLFVSFLVSMLVAVPPSLFPLVDLLSPLLPV